MQEISAAFFDDVPVYAPIAANDFGLVTTASFLPSVSAQVGGKNESVPSSPIHLVPKLSYEVSGHIDAHQTLGAFLYAGYLPSGGEKLFGISASLSERVFGGAAAFAYDLDDATKLWIHVGVQRTSSDLTGGITASNANDSFHAGTNAFLGSIGAQYAEGFYASTLFGAKMTDSTFAIGSDKTNFANSDARLVLQGTIGYRGPTGIHLAFSQVWEPARLTMPRLTAGYSWAFGNTQSMGEALPTSTPAVTSQRLDPNITAPTPRLGDTQSKEPDWKTKNVDIYGNPVLKFVPEESKDGVEVYEFDGEIEIGSQADYMEATKK